MSVVMVTGTNRGIGLGLASRFSSPQGFWDEGIAGTVCEGQGLRSANLPWDGKLDSYN